LPNQGRKIQITIDDAPGPSNNEMRALLAQFGIKTMFFVEGEFVAQRSADLQAIVRAGHKLGLHTWDHPQLTKISDDKIKSEFQKTDDVVKKLTGKSMAPNWRPPYGASNARVRAIAQSLGFTKMWLWDVDSLDWKYRSNTAAIISEVEGGLARSSKAVSDILFHDKHTSVIALRALLPRLQKNGYQLVNFP
jgi:peptidoglycan/xylan/chitin deacetylase (PgdA/CDA1 family)